MYLLRIEHHAPDFDRWKAMFDADPVDRAGKGVRQHQVLRAAEDPGLICIELTFDTAEEANALLAAMSEVWKKVTGTLIGAPSARLFQVAESVRY
jgi:hypothetical protein